MSNSVAHEFSPQRRSHAEPSLYGANGGRKYLNNDERSRVLAVAQALPTDKALFVLCLAWTGARLSEVLALTPMSFQLEAGIVAIRTLKRRQHSVREVPLPPELISALDMHFTLSDLQQDPSLCGRRLWPLCRSTGWRVIKSVMTKASIVGRPACPRGLRHGFAVGALQANVPVTLLQRWLGHSRLETTCLYTGACGPEERRLAERFWRQSR